MHLLTDTCDGIVPDRHNELTDDLILSIDVVAVTRSHPAQPRTHHAPDAARPERKRAKLH
jgi:hypothetical protein